MTTPQEYIFKFGKHKGRPISQIPTSYLRWLYEKPDTVIGLKKIIGKHLDGPADGPRPTAKNEKLSDDMKLEIYSFVKNNLPELIRLEIEKMRASK